jgi:hypothetical protein
MIPKSKVFYHKGQARECRALSCYTLKLELHDGTIVDGYYYCGQFYSGFEKITYEVNRWMIPQEGASVRFN